MSPALTSFLFELINFLLLAAVLGRVFFKPVRQALDDRRQQIAAELDKARQMLDEGEQARIKLEKQRRDLETDIASQRQQIVQAAQREAEQILVAARANAQHERELLRVELDGIRQTHARDLAQSAAQAAARVVEQLLIQMNGPRIELALGGAACRQLAELNGKVETPLTVESAQPLSDEVRALVRESVPASCSAAIRFLVVPELGAGLRIVTNQGLIDATAAGLSKYAEEVLARDLESAS